MRDRSPSGYETFLDNEKAYLDKIAADKAAAENNNTQSTNKMKISSKNSADQIVDPYKDGTKLAKKGKFKDLISSIDSELRDENGKIKIPKIELPERMKIGSELQSANDAIDSKFTSDGFFKGKDPTKMPKLNSYKTKKKYKKAARTLSERLGIDLSTPNSGPKILRQQAKKYNANGSLKIPDFSQKALGSNLMKIGKANLSTSNTYLPHSPHRTLQIPHDS